MGNMCEGDETASIIWKGWNIDPRPAELQSQPQELNVEGKRQLSPPPPPPHTQTPCCPTGALTQRTHTSCQYGHSGADSCGDESDSDISIQSWILFFFSSSKRAWTRHTRTHRARGHGSRRRSRTEALKKYSLPCVSVGFSSALWED